MIKHLKRNFCIFMAVLLFFMGSMSAGDRLNTEAVNKTVTLYIENYGGMDHGYISSDKQQLLAVGFWGARRTVTKLSFGIRLTNDNGLTYKVQKTGDIRPEYEWIDENTIWVDWEGEPTKIGTILKLEADLTHWQYGYSNAEFSFMQEADGRTASVVCDDGIDYAAEGFAQWIGGIVSTGYVTPTPDPIETPEEPYYVHVGDVFTLRDALGGSPYIGTVYSIDVSDDRIVTLVSEEKGDGNYAISLEALSPGTVTVSAFPSKYNTWQYLKRTVVVLAEGEEPTDATEPPTTEPPTTEPPTTEPPTTEPPTTEPPTTEPPTTEPLTTEPTVSGLVLEKTWVSLSNGRQYTIAANQTDLTYKSSNTAVAIVSPSGVVTAIAEGTAIISVFNAKYETAQLRVTVTPYQDAFQSGDVNGDESIDILDVILVNRYLLGSASLVQEQTAAADVDGNGEVDTTDALNILKHVVKLITSFDALKK